MVESIGKTVLASDQYWGSYIGVLKGYFMTPFGIRVKVDICATIEQPSQSAILYKDSHFRRKPYKNGSIVNFDLFNIQLIDIWEGVVNLDEALKLIISEALNVKLGQAVEISEQEWDEAKKEALNDVFANKFCFFVNVTTDYFVSVMVDIIAISKRIAT
jgi:hypothetical protein